jgi:phytoene dehydrogenase-like protein
VTKAIVIGGGIGGLTAAAALGRAGVEVAVFERAPKLKYEKIARYRT